MHALCKNGHSGAATGNRLLDALMASGAGELRPLIEYVELDAGTVVQEAGSPIEYVYFPISGLASSEIAAPDGWFMFSAIGRRSMMPVLRDDDPISDQRVRVMMDLRAARVPRQAFLDNAHVQIAPLDMLRLHQHAELKVSVLRQACRIRHNSDRRLARWLVYAVEESGSRTLWLRHSDIANAMSVRRSSVSGALSELSRQGVVVTRHSSVTVTDLEELQRAACACAASIRETIERVLREKVT
jgi:CRP-like cAMP-binding protein